jgi:hypothetical protein
MEYAKRKYSVKLIVMMCLFFIAKNFPVSGYTRSKIYRRAGVDIEKGEEDIELYISIQFIRKIFI